MKLGVFAVMFRGMSFEQALDYIRSVGVEAVEIGCGGYVGDAFCKPAELLKDKKATAALKDAVTSRGLTISAAISNVLNRDPPFTNKNIGIGFGYDERYTDPIGRAYSLRISYDFQRQK